MMYSFLLVSTSALVVVNCKLVELYWETAFVERDDYDTVDFILGSHRSVEHRSYSGTVPTTGRNFTVHVGSLHKGLPSAFSFYLPKEGQVLSVAKSHNILFTNP